MGLLSFSPWLDPNDPRRRMFDTPQEQMGGSTYWRDLSRQGANSAQHLSTAAHGPPSTVPVQQQQPNSSAPPPPAYPTQQRPASNASPFVAPAGFITPGAPGAAPAQQQPAPAASSNWSNAWRNLLGTSNLPADAPVSDRMNAVADGPLFNTGMALLAASAPGGTGADFASYMQGYRQQQVQREQMRRENTREDEQWSWMRQDREGGQERRRLAAEYIASRPANEQAELRMIDPDQLGAYLQDQRQFGLQQQSMDLQIQEMRNAERRHQQELGLGYSRLAQDRMLNSTLSTLGRQEGDYIGGMRQRLDVGRDVMPFIDELDSILQRNPSIFGAVMEPDMETAIRKFATPGDQQTIADIQRVWTIGADFAREELRGQTPISNLDLRVALQTGASTQQTAQSMRRWIDAARRDYTRMEGQYQSALRYMQPNGPNGPTRNLYEPDPTTGRNWYQDTYTNYGSQGGGAPPGNAGGGGTPPTPDQARAELERRLAPRGERERWSDYERRTGGAGGNGAGGGYRVPAGQPLIPMGSMSVYQRQLWTEYQRSRNGPEQSRAHWERRARRAGLIE